MADSMCRSYSEVVRYVEMLNCPNNTPGLSQYDDYSTSQMYWEIGQLRTPSVPFDRVLHSRASDKVYMYLTFSTKGGYSP